MSARTCSSCGQPVSPMARFCTSCGTKQPDEPPPASIQTTPPRPAPPVGFAAPAYAGAPVYGGGPVRSTPGTATTSVIMGVLTWLLPFMGIGILTFWITAPLAIATGVAARRQMDEDPERWSGAGQATTGLVLGISAMVLATLIVSLMVLARLR